MKPLLVLLIVFLLASLILKRRKGQTDLSVSGRVAMGAMLLFTATGHFIYTKGMSRMLPVFIPYKVEIVYATGMLEIVFGILLWVNFSKQRVGWALIAFFVAVLPANFYAALQHVDYQTGGYTETGVDYLWFRVPLQVLFIMWVYWCTVYAASKESR